MTSRCRTLRVTNVGLGLQIGPGGPCRASAWTSTTKQLRARADLTRYRPTRAPGGPMIRAHHLIGMTVAATLATACSTAPTTTYYAPGAPPVAVAGSSATYSAGTG